MKKLCAWLLVGSCSVLLSACGQMCVGGIGDACHSSNQPPAGGGFTLTPQVAGVASQTVRMGQEMMLRPSGGRPQYYPGEIRPQGCADVNYANFILVPMYPGPCTVNVVDSSTPTQTATLTITILPRLPGT